MKDIKIEDKTDIETKIYLYGKSMELGKIVGLVDTIHLLNLLEESPKQYKEIASSLSLSQPSLSRRLIMLQNLNILLKSLTISYKDTRFFIHYAWSFFCIRESIFPFRIKYY